MTHSETERHDEASPMCGRSTLTAPPEVLVMLFDGGAGLKKSLSHTKLQ